MLFDIGVGEAFLMVLLPLMVLASVYWVVRTAVRHGKNDAERDRASVADAWGPLR